eukprot:9947799-Alexandrium_andersonii.AAC.1
MSASLVGSEMCIRDRLYLLLTAPKMASSAEEPPGSREALTAAAVTARPVSYTHLTLPTICSV